MKRIIIEVTIDLTPTGEAGLRENWGLDESTPIEIPIKDDLCADLSDLAEVTVVVRSVSELA